MSGSKLSIQNATLIGTGKSLDPGKGMTVQDIIVPNKYRSAHMAVFGTSGSGKTRLAENIVEQDIRAGRSVVYLDPKIDQEIASKIVQVAVACGRENDLMFINTVFPEDSALIDPMSYYFIHEELVEHCVAGIKEGKEPFYRNVGKEIVSAAITALAIDAKETGKQEANGESDSSQRLKVNLQEIKEHMSREALEKLKQKLSGILTKEAEDAAADLGRIVDTGQEYYSKVASSLRVALMELTTGNIGKIIGRADENRFLKRLEEDKPVILVVQLGSNIVHDAAFTLGKVVISMIQSFIGRVYSSNRKKVKPALCLHIDEAPSLLCGEIGTLFAQARGADCWITIYAQSMNQFFDKLGPDAARSVLSCANSQVYLKSPDSETAKYVADHFGTVKKLSPVIAQGSITTREVEEDVIKPFDVIKLKPREFFMLSYADENYTGRWKGRTGDTSPAWVEIVYPEAPGL